MGIVEKGGIAAFGTGGALTGAYAGFLIGGAFGGPIGAIALSTAVGTLGGAGGVFTAIAIQDIADGLKRLGNLSEKGSAIYKSITPIKIIFVSAVGVFVIQFLRNGSCDQQDILCGSAIAGFLGTATHLFIPQKKPEPTYFGRLKNMIKA